MTVQNGDRVDVEYCEGWDPAVREASAPMPESEARRRDASGEPYAVLLSSRAQPKALFQVDWHHGYLGLFLFDSEARRDREYEYRQLDEGLLHLRRYRQWRPTAGSGPECVGTEPYFSMEIDPDGRARRILNSDGSLHIGADVPAEHHTVAKAEFGAWTAYVSGRMLGTADPIALHPAAAPGAPVPGPRGTALWTAPVPLQPGDLEALFTSGTRLACKDGTAVVEEPARAGLLRLPTGSVTARDPHPMCSADQAFTVTVPPGDYPVLIATMKWEGMGWGETPAAMLRITDEPTVVWELALQPGQDPRLLSRDEFYGFGVDTGTACFFDASGRDTLPELFKNRAQEARWDHEKGSCTVDDPVGGTNLIAYCSGHGDGSYPVWIGRSAEGSVTCFVADMLVVQDGRPLPPALPGPVGCISPYAGRTSDRRTAPFTDPGSTSDFIEGRIADVVAFKEERQYNRFR
ncbi:DUF4241 domain-containing protein [Streptomyces sp. NPDC094448]|uniref:DUF4241 domain-containing protein n=1 Tax=Streptomyces sp. NPDC094448 TaxID=3366063 RepID=UPI003812EFA9